MTRQYEMEPAEALAGTLAAMAEAARYTGGGVRSVGRRAGRAGTDVGRRAWANAVDSAQRASYAYRIYRGEERIPRRRPAEYAATGVVVGITAAMAVIAIGRALARRLDSGQDDTTGRHPLDQIRAAARTVRRRVPTTAGEPGDAARPDETAGVTTSAGQAV
jgi:hypothetical protein